jgi:hypothetical protein
MSDEKDWLTILTNATTYGDLRIVFNRMDVDSQTVGDREAMVASIDEAIRRIEQERARDQAELDGFASQYDAFKQEQSGVIGWFKRKMPFTETRKQELAHRDALNDQTAEILADNFMIARAQMLKERVASPTSRRMGQWPTYWRSQFKQADSVYSIAEYGKIVSELGKELAVAKVFVDMVAVDIDGFSAAKFIQKEDQLRSQEDSIAARKELKALSDESQEKANLRNSALSRLKGLLMEDLSAKDSDFRSMNQRLTLLKGLLEKQPLLAKSLEEHLAIAKALVAKMIERESLPEKREKIEMTLHGLKREWEEAERKRLKASDELDGPSRLYQAAVAESQQAQASLKATKPLYDAYLAEQNRTSSNAEVTSDSDFEISTSNVVTEYNRLENAATAAAQLLHQRTPLMEQAKRVHDLAIKESKMIQDRSDTHTMELKKIVNLEAEIQQQLFKLKQNAESTFSALRNTADSYMDVASQVTWTENSNAAIRAIQELLDSQTKSSIASKPFSMERSIMPSDTKGLVELRRNTEVLEKAILVIETDRKASLHEFATMSNQRREAIQRHGQMLLDQRVLSELDLDERT